MEKRGAIEAVLVVEDATHDRFVFDITLDKNISEQNLEEITRAIQELTEEGLEVTVQRIAPEDPHTTPEQKPHEYSSPTNYWSEGSETTVSDTHTTYSESYYTNNASQAFAVDAEDQTERKVREEIREKKVADGLRISYICTYKSSDEQEAAKVNKLINFTLNILLYELERF